MAEEDDGENKLRILHRRTLNNFHNRVPCNTCKVWYTRIFCERRRRGGISVGGAPSSSRPNVFCCT
jgi:hypothetical protein